jgi:hypothetical protein
LGNSNTSSNEAKIGAASVLVLDRVLLGLTTGVSWKEDLSSIETQPEAIKGKKKEKSYLYQPPFGLLGWGFLCFLCLFFRFVIFFILLIMIG